MEEIWGSRKLMYMYVYIVELHVCVMKSRKRTKSSFHFYFSQLLYGLAELLTPFAQIRFVLLVVKWINNEDIFWVKNAVNQAFQCTRKKPSIDWLIRNWWRLWQQRNSNLDSNHGLRISHTNDQMNNQVGEQTNEGWVKIEWVSAGSKRLICELELVGGTLLIDIKQAMLPKQNSCGI